MSLFKYASFDVLSAEIAGNRGLRRQASKTLGVPSVRINRVAHRADFQYEPRPGYLYIRSRAISSRCNDNHDEFPAAEIKKAYRTFIGKPVFVNHANDNHRRFRGVNIDAALHEDFNPDGSPDTWTEVLMEVDAAKFPKLAQAVLAGEIDRTSMGCDVAYSICSACGNRATTPMEYCAHIPRLKGSKFRRYNAAKGQPEEEIIREICYGLGFFENSLLVEEPADPTAFTLGVDTRGLDFPPHTGSVMERPRVDDSGVETASPEDFHQHFSAAIAGSPFQHHVTNHTPDEIRSQGMKPLMTNDRKTGMLVHDHGDGRIEATGLFNQSDKKGAGVDLLRHGIKNHGVNYVEAYGPHLPKLYAKAGFHSTEQYHFDKDQAAPGWDHRRFDSPNYHIMHLGQPAGKVGSWQPLRLQMNPSGTSTGTTQNGWLPSEPKSRGTSIQRGAASTSTNSMTTGMPPSLTSESHLTRSSVRLGTRYECSRKPLMTCEQGYGTPPRKKCRACGSPFRTEKGVHGVFDWTGEGRYPVEKADSIHTTEAQAEKARTGDKVTRWIPEHSLPKESGKYVFDVDYATNKDTLMSGELVAGTRRISVEAPSHDQARLQAEQMVAGHGNEPTGARRVGQWMKLAGDNQSDYARTSHAFDANPGSDKCRYCGGYSDSRVHQAHQSKLAYGEVVAPPEVDTLREDICPVCGEHDSYNGEECEVCGFVKPPEMFMDPDVDVAKKQDLRQDQQNAADQADTVMGQGDLMCPNCGAEFTSAEADDEAGEPHFAPAATNEAEVENEVEEEGEEEEAQAPPNADAGDLSKPVPPGVNAPDQAKGIQQDDDPDEAAVQDGSDEEQGPDEEAEEENALAEAGTEEQEQDAADIQADTGYEIGDVCPNCGKGILQEKSDTEEAPEDEDQILDAAADDDEEDDDQEGKGFPPGLKNKSNLYRPQGLGSDREGSPVPMPTKRRTPQRPSRAPQQRQAAQTAPQGQQAPERPRSLLHEALSRQAGVIRQQQVAINRQAALLEAAAIRTGTLERQMAFVAKAAGIENPLAEMTKDAFTRVSALLKVADQNDPAQPIPEPPAQAPWETTEQARQADGMDDVTQMGASPITDVSADATEAVDQPYGEVANQPLNLNQVDVTAPVEGTQERRPDEEMITRPDVRIGNPDNPQPAFGWGMGPVGQGRPGPGGPQGSSVGTTGSQRTYACIRLAKLRLQANIDQGDDIDIAERLLHDASLSDESIQTEINTLTRVVQASQGQQTQRTATRHLVPRVADQPQGQRTTASMQQSPGAGIAMESASIGSVSADEFLLE